MRADPHQLTRVLSNLLSNSIKYTDTGTIHIGMQAESEGAPKGYLWIYVKDTGTGIDAQRRKQLFHLFAGDDSRYDSTGVGLVYVKQTMEAYGGRVFLDSVKGEGTKVTLEFPALRGSS